MNCAHIDDGENVHVCVYRMVFFFCLGFFWRTRFISLYHMEFVDEQIPIKKEPCLCGFN